MKVELALFDVEKVWRGLVKVDGELFKVYLFPGSATKEWEAVLMSGDFVECSPKNKLTQAIEKGYGEYIKAGQSLTQLEVDKLTELVAGNQEALEEIKKVLEGGGLE